MADCRVKSFRATWSDWRIRWGTPFMACGPAPSTIQLPVRFRLELEEGCSKGDCVVGQLRRGRSEIGNSGAEIFETFVADGAIGERYWWDGTRLSRSGRGEWDGAGRVATFEDAPGFFEAPAGKSLYMGAARGSDGYFDFKTFVKDRASDKVVREINWSMRIDVPHPGKGGFWWSFSDQA